MPEFIQFMHNGKEPPNSEAGTRWNTKHHVRKFIKSNGIRLDEDHSEIKEEIMFWCEWEPESLLVKDFESNVKGGPHYLYEPYFVRPTSYEGLQGTDPFVFGKEFRYCWCLQPRFSRLRNLNKGSVILFGSRVNRKFALDTVFVVYDYIPFKQDGNNCKALLQHVDETYKIVTMNPILMGKAASSTNVCARTADSNTYRSYRGATFRDRKEVNGMFSFFPCQAYTEGRTGFARPTIQMPQISGKRIRGISAATHGDFDVMEKYWNEVVNQVKKTCSLGVFADMPNERPRYFTT